MPYPPSPALSLLAGAMRRGLLFGLLATTPLLPMVAQAAGAELGAVRHYDIAAGSLDQALNRFASTAGILLSVDAQLTEGKRSAGLRGRYTTASGLALLLDGSGLQAVPAGNGWSVQAAPTGTALTLGATQINAREQENAWGAVDGIVAKRSATGSKTDTPLTEIPQTINVVTAAEIAERGALSIAQALRYTPGVSSSGFTDSHMLTDEMSSRGFAPAPLYLDGAYLPYAGSLGGAPQVEPYSLERVEVLKGPASVLYGQNQPGGIINMVTKKPTEEARGEVKLGAASYDRTSAAVDVSGPLNEDRSLLYRFLALGNTGSEQIDYTESQRLFLAPSLTWNLNDATALTVYAQVQRDDALPDYQPLPVVGTLKRGPGGQRISRDFFSGDPRYNDYQRKQYVLGANFEHQFNDDLTLRQSVRYVDLRDDYKGFYLRWYGTDGSGQTDYSRATRNKLNWEQHNSTLSLDNNLEFKLATGALQHTLLAGLDYRHFSRQYDGYNDYFTKSIDLYNPDYSVTTDTPPLTHQWDNTVGQLGAYLQDQIKWGDFILTLGGRQDRATINNKDLIDDSRTVRKDSAFTGRAGLTWLAGYGFAPYVSYSESFLPVVGSDFSGKAFEPTTGKQVEAGVKYQPPGQDALLTLSVFEIKQQNMQTSDFEHPGFSVQKGEVRSRGAEFEAKATVDQALDLIAALTYLDIRTTRSNDPTEIDKRLVGQAPWSGSLWANYRLSSGALEGLGLGAGVRWVGSQYGNSANTLRLPSYTVFDAAVHYDLGRVDAALRGAQVSLNVQNLLDKTYVSSCNWELGCYYGKARTVSAEVAYRW